MTPEKTDVSLRDYVAAELGALDRHLTSELDSLRRETTLASENASKAIEVAAHEAEERLKAHNGLIDQMRERAALFSPRESLEDYKVTVDRRLGKVERFLAMLLGGLILLSFIGVANLVKLWLV